MNFTLQRHTRIAGSLAIFVGLYLHNWSVVLLGNVIIAVGYMWSAAKIEQFIEAQEPKSKEEADDARN